MNHALLFKNYLLAYGIFYKHNGSEFCEMLSGALNSTF